MPQKYQVELSDGRKFIVEAEGGQPSEADILASLDQSPAEAVAEPGLFSGPKGTVLDLAIPAAKGFGSGLLSLIDPRTYAGLAKTAAKTAVRAGKAGPLGLGVEFGPDVAAITGGLKEQVSEPKKAAELMGVSPPA